jgi:Holliday junction resolvase
MSGPPRGDNYERELEQRLWNEDWATFRVAGSGAAQHESADLVAIKNGYIYIFEVKSVEPSSTPVDVRDDRQQLGEIKERMSPESMMQGDYSGDFVMEAYFAIRFKDHNMWYYKHWNNFTIPYASDLEKMYNILMEAD